MQDWNIFLRKYLLYTSNISKLISSLINIKGADQIQNNQILIEKIWMTIRMVARKIYYTSSILCCNHLDCSAAEIWQVKFIMLLRKIDLILPWSANIVQQKTKLLICGTIWTWERERKSRNQDVLSCKGYTKFHSWFVCLLSSC